MPQWEYMVRRVGTQLALLRLQQHGKEGWELVSVHPCEKVSAKWEYIFKREKDLAAREQDLRDYRKGDS
jgi:hypothetical protein